MNGCGEIRPAKRGPSFIDLLDGLAHGAVVDGERRINVRISGESEEADPLVRHGFHQFVDDDFRLGETVRFDIAHPHAFRNI
jgi:hypothetical protein